MEKQLCKKRKNNPVLIFVSVFYLLLGALFLGVAALSCYGIVLQGQNLFASEMFLSLAIMFTTGLVMFISGIRGLRGRGNYLMGFVMLLLGGAMIVYGLTSKTFNWSSLLAAALGGLYILGVKINRK